MESNGMVYVRVLRAIAATNGNGALNSLDELAKQLNDEFAILGIRVRRDDLDARQSALDIAQMISRKIQ